MTPCRCGWNGEGPHGCHRYVTLTKRCGKPATPKYIGSLVCLAGAQMKLGAYETFACEEHWEEHKKQMEEQRGKG